jgi:hypothetical protein
MFWNVHHEGAKDTKVFNNEGSDLRDLCVPRGENIFTVILEAPAKRSRT